MTVSTLYICYFGLREPLVQTQVLPYLRHLAAEGVRVHLLTFEPRLKERWDGEGLARERRALSDAGIEWSCLSYHKSPSVPATAFDILAGAREIVKLARRRKIDVLHARAHVPLAMALLARTRTGCRLIFDIRGLMAEEYADAGVWKETSLPFRAVKRLERAGLRRADQLVVLTERMRDWLVSRGLAEAGRVEVIPCCVDFARFDEVAHNDDDEEAWGTPGAGAEAERFEVVYAGAVTGLYMLREMAGFFRAVRARRPGAFFRVMTTAPPRAASSVLGDAGLSDEEFWVGAATPREVPGYLERARLGVSFRSPTFSQIAASPTKIPEYLAAGLPVVSNAGIGDVDELLEGERVGVVVREFAEGEYARAADEALALADDPEVRRRCMQVARRRFDLATVGGAGYLNVYERIGEALAAEREGRAAEDRESRVGV